jgi:hypothetical protein
MRKLIPVLGAIVALAIFAAVGSGNSESSNVIRSHIDPSEAKTIDVHRLTPAQGRTAGVQASGGGSKSSGIRYLGAEVTLDDSGGFVAGGAIKCPKKWHPISGFHASEHPFVSAFFNAPTSDREWVVLVYAQSETGPPIISNPQVLVGVVCEKGLPVL